MGTGALHVWRHARAELALGRCIGRTDLRVNRRRAKRLAHRMRAFARRHGLPRIVITSPLERCQAVGRWLARWGWKHDVDPLLIELDFGRWDGLPWSLVPRQEFDAWCSDFQRKHPGGGESVGELILRVQAFDPGTARLVVTHGGWLSAATWLRTKPSSVPSCADWPTPPKTGHRIDLPWLATVP